MVRISAVCRELNSPRNSVGAPRRWKRAFLGEESTLSGAKQVSRPGSLFNAECDGRMLVDENQFTFLPRAN
jgi:hypothetical protein